MTQFDNHRLQKYIKLEGHTGVQCARNGSEYFYKKRVDGLSQIFKSSIHEKWPHQLSFYDEGIDQFTLAPDGRSMAVIVNKKGSEHNPIALVDTITGTSSTVFEIAGAQAGAIVWHHDSSRFLFRSNHENMVDFKIYEYDLAVGEYRLLINTKGWSWPMEYSPEGTHILYMSAKSSTDQDIYLFDLESRTTAHLTPHEEDTRYFALFGRSHLELYLLCDEGHEYNKLFRWDLKAGAQKPIGPDLEWEIGGLVTSPCKRFLMFSANEEGYSSLYILDAWLDVELPSPETRGVLSSYEFASSETIIFCYEFPRRTSQVYRWSISHAKSDQLTWSSFQGLNPHKFIQPRIFEIESFDGLKVPSFLYLPKGYRRGTPIPIVMHIHGGPASQFRPMFYKHFQYLLELGIGICAPNVRGSSGYGSKYMAADDYKKRMDSVQDAVEIAKQLIEQKIANPEKLAVVGGSYGGFMVLSLITEQPDLFKAAVDVVGIANLVTFLKNTGSYRRKIRETEYGPLEDEEFLKSISPIHKMDRVITPLLVVHGETDPRVPVDEARQVISALEERGQKVESLIFPDEGHGVRKLSNQLVYYETMCRFLTDYLL